MLRPLLDLFFPHQCVTCDRVLEAEATFCTGCAQDLEAVHGETCPSCGEPVERRGPCARCAVRPPPMRKSFVPFLHHGPIARAIHRWKYEDHPELTRPLAGLLVVSAAAFLKAAPLTIAPIPLHESRYRERQYDQAALLAAELARITNRRLVAAALVREKRTQRQVGLEESARERNVHGAFTGSVLCEGTPLLLVDDVMTTGATARAAAAAACEAGATEVWVLTLARAYAGAGT